MSTLERILDSEIIFNYLLKYEKKDWNDIIVSLLETSIKNIESQEEMTLDQMQEIKKIPKPKKVIKRPIPNQQNFKDEFRYQPRADSQEQRNKGEKNKIKLFESMGKHPIQHKHKGSKNDEIMFYNSIDKLTAEFNDKNNRMENNYETKLNKLTKRLNLMENPGPYIKKKPKK
ncbi:MAG: hypothetical protein MJ252_17525 [archaeon]|nr:hypothetical protein [archaeon]